MAGGEELEAESCGENGEILCKYCKKKCQSGVKCVRCSESFHNSCALRIIGLKVVTGNGQVNCCSSSNINESKETQSGGMSKVNVELYKQLLTSKDDAIKDLKHNNAILVGELTDKVSILKQQIILLNEMNHMYKQAQKISDKTITADKGSKKTSGEKLEIFKTNSFKKAETAEGQGELQTDNTEKNPSKQMKVNTNADNYERGYRKKLNELIYMNEGQQQTAPTYRDIARNISDLNYYYIKKANNGIDIDHDCENNDTDDGFIPVRRRQRQRRVNIQRGTAALEVSADNGKKDNKPVIKGAIQFNHLHVYGLDPSTNEEDLIAFLKQNSFIDVKCEKLKSRRPEEYSSFKVSVRSDDFDRLNAPELWPVGVKFNRFLFRILNVSKKDP